MIKLFTQHISENLSYTDIFGKIHTHDEVLKQNVIDRITQIIIDELGLSEKNFKQYDIVSSYVKNIFENETELYDEAVDYYNNEKRIELFAEIIYDKYFRQNINNIL